MATEFPSDENGEVLRRMQADGDDLSKPREINFHYVFPTRAQAVGFIELIPDRDLRMELCWYAECELWECTVVKYMVPTHADITALEGRMATLAQPLEGTADGWGCFQADTHE